MQLLQAPPISVVLLPTEKKAIRVIADTSRSGWCNTRDFVKTISGAYRRRNVRAAWSSSTTDSAAATETASLRAVRDVSTTTLIRVITKVRVDFVIVHERLSLLHNFSPSLSLSLSLSLSARRASQSSRQQKDPIEMVSSRTHSSRPLLLQHL